MTGFALVLLLGAAAAWIAAQGARARARSYLRLAAVLYAAMAVAHAANLAPAAVTDIVMTLGSTVLCVGAFAGFRRNPRILTASTALAFSGLAGIAAAMLDLPVLAAVPQVLSAVFTFLIARRGLFERQRSGLYLALAAVCLLGAAACRLTPDLMARIGFMLFAAAAVAGVALASNVFVEEHGRPRKRLPVGRLR